MAKLIIMVEVDRDTPSVDPHEAAADILYHYEEARTVNQDMADLSFIDAQWMNDAVQVTFSQG